MVRAVRQRPGGTTTFAGVVLLTCSVLVPACGGEVTPRPRVTTVAAPDAPPDTPDTTRRFRHRRSRFVVSAGKPSHRGRDVLVAEGEPQDLEAKIAYGVVDKDLHDEDVDVFLLADAGATLLGTVRTSADGPADDGGRARLRLAGDRALPVGRHRIRFVVRGDGSTAEIAAVVVRRGQDAFVSDVDGTLTASEFAEVPAIVEGKLPLAHPGAARVFGVLASRGLLPVYVTARPEWLVPRTRAFLEQNGFPPGVLVTKRDKSGALGSAAAAYKKTELARIASVVRIRWAFGNTPSDADAYAALLPDASRRVLYRYEDVTFGGRRIEAYDELASEVASASP